MLNKILENARGVSKIFLIAGLPVTYQKGDHPVRQKGDILNPDTIREIVNEMYKQSEREETILVNSKDDDFSFSIPKLGRFRCNVFYQRGSLAAVIKVIKFGIPSYKEMGIPEMVMDIANNRKGLVLVTGEAGSGKTTTLSCLIDKINHERDGHIITLENPIEHTHRHDKSMVTQREIFIDTPGFKEGLRGAMKEKPSVIFMSELQEDIAQDALTACEMGILLMSSMYTSSAVDTIERFLDIFPMTYRKQAQNRLSNMLSAIVCQKLIPSKDGHQIPVFEVLRMKPIVKDMIRKDNLLKLEGVMQASDDMATMDDTLLKLYNAGRITKETVVDNCTHYDVMVRKLGIG